MPCFIILLCVLPDNFTHQGESHVGTKWVNGIQIAEAKKYGRYYAR
jgi:hypothetical protein